MSTGRHRRPQGMRAPATDAAAAPPPPTDALPRTAATLPPDAHDFVLYIAGFKPSSHRALLNLQSFCRQHLPDRHRITVVDVCANPTVARNLNIVALPTLIRITPQPGRFIGDLTDTTALAMVTDVSHD